MRFQKRLLAIGLLAALTSPQETYAADGAAALVGFIRLHIISEALVAFWGIAFAAMAYYAIRIVIDAYKDDALSTATTSFTQAFIGFVIIACASAFANAFDTGSPSMSNTTTLTPVGDLTPAISSVASFIIEMSGGIFVLMVVLAGIRMATTQGDQGAFDKAKHLLVLSCAGVALMFIASAIITGIATPSAIAITTELRGIALFLLEILGFACVVALIIAGVFLVVSIEESYRDKAKQIIIGTLITLIVVFAMYGLIITFTS